MRKKDGSAPVEWNTADADISAAMEHPQWEHAMAKWGEKEEEKRRRQGADCQMKDSLIAAQDGQQDY